MSIRIKQTFFFYICLILKLRVYSQGNFVFDSANVQINALNINSKESEFGPFKMGNRLYYTSSRERRLGVINVDEATGHQFLDLYSGELKDSVTVVNAKPLRNAINNSYNQGSSFFDKESSRLYYAGNVRADYKGEKYKLAIYSTELKEGKFQEPRIELLLPDTFLASHPMIHDGKLYFSSNLKEGKGKADIYRAEMVNGRWGNITNLKELNSAENDYFPFVINEREIYFSSDRPGGLGRLDLYKYTLTDGAARIQNLGKPVNSPYDDYSAYVDASQENGYFTTTRNSNQDDIYYFAKTWPSFNNCLDAIKETYCYDLTDEKSLETDSLKGYFYEWDFGDGEKQKGVSVTHCYAQPGTYVVNLNIIDVSTKAVFLNQTAMDVLVDSIVQLKINTLDTILVNKNVTINTVGTYLPGKRITGYYFEVDGKRIRKESFEYAFAKTGKYRIKLGVEYNDLELNTNGLMCTNLDVHIVDSAAWVPFEKRKLEEVIAKFEARNIRSEMNGLGELNYDAELAYNGKLGLSREKLAEKIDEFLSDENKRPHPDNFAYQRPMAPNKNLGTDRNLLHNLDEELDVTFKVHLGHSKTKMDTTVLNAKGLYGIKEEFIAGEYVYTYGNEAKAKDIEKYYRKALNAGIAEVDVYAYKNDAIKMDEYLAAQSATDSFFGKNINGQRNLMSELSEEAELTYKVHLGKSKTKMDTTVLNAKGIYGIKEEFIAGEYVYTYGNEAKAKDIDVYYKKALSAGLADVDVFAYKNNAIKMDEYLAADSKKDSFFNKNLNGERNLLTELNEDLDVTFRVHLAKSKTKLDTAVFNAKGLHGIKEERINGEYVYTYGNKASAQEISKYYKKALAAGFAEVEVYAYKNNALKMDDYLAAQPVEKSFFGKNINGTRNLLSDLSEENDVTFRVHLGKSKTKMDTTVLNAKGIYGIKEEFINGQYVYTYGNKAKAKDIDKLYKKALSAGLAEVDVFAYKNNTIKLDEYLAAQNPDKGFFANIGANRNGLSELSEENDVTFRVHLGKSKTKMDTTVLNAKGIYGIKEELIAGEYVYTYGNTASKKEIEKYYNKALLAGVKPDVFAYKNNILKMDDYLAATDTKGTNYQNLNAIKDTLLHLEEDAEINFRVYLGKSKVKRDTTALHAMGMIGIKEELIDGEYAYTYGNEKRVVSVEKLYRQALQAGVKEPAIIAYKGNKLVPNQSVSSKVATFGDEVLKTNDVIAGVKPKREGFFRRNRREKEEEKQKETLMASAEKITTVEGVPTKALEEPETRKDTAIAQVAVTPKTENANEKAETGPEKTGGPDPVNDPKENDSFKLSAALRPEDVKIKDVPSVDSGITNADKMTSFVNKYGDASAKDLEFRVQVSAFKYRNRYEFPHLKKLGELENTLTEGGITRITIGGKFDTYKKALELNRKVVAAGQKDAFVTVFYKGKRVYAENLEEMGIFLTK